MQPNQVIDLAEEVLNGDTIEVVYVKPADVLNTRNHLKAKGVPAEELPKMKEGGSKPSKVLYKRTTFTVVHDERGYFRKVLEEQAQNLNPTKAEPMYDHVRGIHYTKRTDGMMKDYVRFSARADRLKPVVKYTTDARGRNEVAYDDIEEYLQASARTDYEHYNRQLDITSTGKVPDVEIIQLTLDVERIVKLTVTK